MRDRRSGVNLRFAPESLPGGLPGDASVRAWIRGAGPLGERDDPREYYAELPVDEFYTVAGEMSAQQRRLRRPDEGSKHDG